MIQQSERLQSHWVRIVPHGVDTLLLLTALSMVVWSRQFPFVEPWLTAKVIALLVYILLGMVALKWGKTLVLRVSAWLGGMLVFSYIVAVAMVRSPIPI